MGVQQETLIADAKNPLKDAKIALRSIVSSQPDGSGAALFRSAESGYIVRGSSERITSRVDKIPDGREKLVFIIDEASKYDGPTLRKSVPADPSIRQVRLAQNEQGKTQIVVELNKGYRGYISGSLLHRSISIQKIEANVPPRPKKYQTLEKKTLDRCVLTYDDGPHPNDIQIAKEALKTGARVDFYWNTKNMLNSAGRKELDLIPANTTIGQWFVNRWKMKQFINDHMSIEAQNTIRQVYQMAGQSGGRIVIGSHSTFHPHSGNKTLGQTDLYTAGKGAAEKTVQYRHQLHPTSPEYQKRDPLGRTGWEDDINFFEQTMSEALSVPFKVKHVRLPGSNANMVHQLYKDFLESRGAEYRDFTHDSYDSNPDKADVKPRKAFRDTMTELKANPSAERIYLWHSKTFNKGDIANMLPQ